MTPDQAVRWIAYEAADCRGRDASEALCLLLPALLRALKLTPMAGVEAEVFRRQLREYLKNSEPCRPPDEKRQAAAQMKGP
jgi:hypothetical protein